jgi:hypothetical protein
MPGLHLYFMISFNIFQVCIFLVGDVK